LYVLDRGVHSGTAASAASAAAVFSHDENLTSTIKPIGTAKELEYFFASDARQDCHLFVYFSEVNILSIICLIFQINLFWLKLMYYISDLDM